MHISALYERVVRTFAPTKPTLYANGKNTVSDKASRWTEPSSVYKPLRVCFCAKLKTKVGTKNINLKIIHMHKWTCNINVINHIFTCLLHTRLLAVFHCVLIVPAISLFLCYFVLFLFNNFRHHSNYYTGLLTNGH